MDLDQYSGLKSVRSVAGLNDLRGLSDSVFHNTKMIGAFLVLQRTVIKCRCLNQDQDTVVDH